MLLPQSSAFGALKNRLNSVSAIGLLHTPAAMLTPARPSVVAGMSSASLPSATGTGTVSGRLGRTRDVNSGSDVKWPELMEKFKQTQEKARRRNERLLRGDDSDAVYAGASSGGAGRSLLDSSAIGGGNGAGGRESRTSNRSGELGGRGPGGRNSALGRPLSYAGGAGGVGGAAGLSKAGGSNVPALPAGIAGNAAGGAGDGRAAPHKRGHSLAGNLGKFASGIARAGGSRDRDKDKGKR